jgi:predicted ATPase/transcriptional regulator with XRE-family HTH domain
MLHGEIVAQNGDYRNVQLCVQLATVMPDGSTAGGSKVASAMENEAQAPGSSAFGALLRRYRVAAGLSQEILAERARMSREGISALERGFRRTPHRETLALLAGALELSDEASRDFEAAATRWVLLGRHASVTVGPWVDRAKATLPLALTSFVGREAELGEIATLVRDHRMVTLTGAGGVGKTQTALQVATTLSDTAYGAVCFAGLAPIGNPSLVVAAIASTFGVQEVPGRPLLDALLAYLKKKSLLLILDNCEHVISEAATVAGVLLAGCPGLRILATSREPLRSAGEHAYRLPSLRVPTPETSDRVGAAAAAEYGAMVLFTDRACAVDHRFILSDKNVPIVAELCRRLDGIPLAIELAAARVNQLPLKALAEKLDDRFRILTGGERTALPRQQTLRAAIDWSYDLLAPQEKQVFERLSGFAGGFTVAAATAVCGDEENTEAELFDVLSSLVNKSLLIAEFEGMEPRYRLLESFREYAREKLVTRGEAEIVAQRHARAYLEIAERLEAAYCSEADAVWNEPTQSELDNWRAVLNWGLAARRNVALGQRLIGKLVGGMRPPLAPSEIRHWTDLALDLVDESTPAIVLASISYADAVVANRFDESEKELASSEKAFALYRELGDDHGIALSRTQAARALVRLGRSAEAEPMLIESLAKLRELGPCFHLGYALRVMSQADTAKGDFTAARSHMAEAVALYKAIGAHNLVAMSLAADLPEVEFCAGNAELAVRQALDALPTVRVSNEMHWVVDALNNLSVYLTFLSRFDEAEACARESLAASSETHFPARVARAIDKLAVLAAVRPRATLEFRPGSHVRAARLFGFVDARYNDLGSPRGDLIDQQQYEQALAVLRGAMDSDQLARLMKAGAAMREEQAIDEALAG